MYCILDRALFALLLKKKNGIPKDTVCYDIIIYYFNSVLLQSFAASRASAASTAAFMYALVDIPRRSAAAFMISFFP